MNTIEQAVTLKDVVPRLVRDVADLQLRVEKLEKAHARVGKVVERPPFELPSEYYESDERTGSIDGLDDVALRVYVPAGWWAE